MPDEQLKWPFTLNIIIAMPENIAPSLENLPGKLFSWFGVISRRVITEDLFPAGVRGYREIQRVDDFVWIECTVRVNVSAQSYYAARQILEQKLVLVRTVGYAELNEHLPGASVQSSSTIEDVNQ